MEMIISFYWTTAGVGTGVQTIRKYQSKGSKYLYFCFSDEIYSLQLVLTNNSITQVTFLILSKHSFFYSLLNFKY